MTKRASEALSGYINLSDDERREVDALIDRFRSEKLDKRAKLKEEYKRSYGVLLGPVATVCPCCGRS